MLNYGWSDWIGRNDIVLIDLCHQMCNFIFGLIYLLLQKIWMCGVYFDILWNDFEDIQYIYVRIQYILNWVKYVIFPFWPCAKYIERLQNILSLTLLECVQNQLLECIQKKLHKFKLVSQKQRIRHLAVRETAPHVRFAKWK